MMQSAQASILEDGKRLHLHHGPIDLVIEAFGAGREMAYRKAAQRFETVLEELVSELPKLRTQGKVGRPFEGPVAQRMQRAIAPYCDVFVTPMAAVAGSVADEILGVIKQVENIEKAYANNGGDVAFHLSAGQKIDAAMAALPGGKITICAQDPFRGIATSGWRGRSYSLGIADSVSVIAEHAASADVAATMIANAIDLPNCAKIDRTPANELAPDSDLGSRLVTTGVGDLSELEMNTALNSGTRLARNLLDENLIGGAVLQLGNKVQQVGSLNINKPESDFHQLQELVDA